MCAVEFNYKTYFTEEQWKKLTSDVKEECKKDPLFAKQVASELKSGGDPSTIGTQLAYPGGKLKSGPIKGFELERTTADSATTGVKMNVDNLEALKPKYKRQTITQNSRSTMGRIFSCQSKRKSGRSQTRYGAYSLQQRSRTDQGRHGRNA